MKVRVDFKGGQDIARQLQQMSTRASKGILRNALLTVGGPIIQQGMEARAPRAPGAPDIADNIVVSVARGDRSETGAAGSRAAVAIGPSTAPRSDQPGTTYGEQGMYLEFGTEHIEMQPFARPTFDADAPKVLAPLGAALWAAIVLRNGGTRGLSSGGGLL